MQAQRTTRKHIAIARSAAGHNAFLEQHEGCMAVSDLNIRASQKYITQLSSFIGKHTPFGILPSAYYRILKGEISDTFRYMHGR